jgi:hypothetical protein
MHPGSCADRPEPDRRSLLPKPGEGGSSSRSPAATKALRQPAAPATSVCRPPLVGSERRRQRERVGTLWAHRDQHASTCGLADHDGILMIIMNLAPSSNDRQASSGPSSDS